MKPVGEKNHSGQLKSVAYLGKASKRLKSRGSQGTHHSYYTSMAHTHRRLFSFFIFAERADGLASHLPGSAVVAAESEAEGPLG